MKPLGAGLSVLLSLLIVAVFAVALHRPDPRTRQSERNGPKPVPREAANPGQASVEVDFAGAPGSEPGIRQRDSQEPAGRRAPPRPRSVATTVQDGENLADVARRVYGVESEEIMTRLWKANRDQLARMDAPLKAGSLVRTP